MNPSTIEIENIVREILAQLAAAPKETKSDGGEKKSDGGRRAAESGGESTDNKQASTVTVAARVVTMREIADRLPTMRRLVVSREAIVTPAVRDELLRRGIELSRADAAKSQPAAVRLVLMTSGTDFDPTALAATLVREGFGVECSASDCLIAATESLSTELKTANTLGVLLTAHAAAALCLANRIGGVRAIGGASAPVVAAASAAVGANLLAVDPRAGNFYQLKQMISEYARGGVRACPEVFRAKLA